MNEEKPSEIRAGRDLGLCVCGRQIYEAFANYQGQKDVPALIHEMPYCQPFIDMELVEYMAYVRRSRGITEN